METLDVAPHRIAYRRLGSGPDLLFVHGWPLHMATFRALAPLLAERFTCHLIDLPGSGETRSPEDAPLDFASAAAVVRGVADALALERYALVAHDSGGFIARMVAAADARVAAVVSGNTEIPGHTPTIIKALLAAAMVPGGAEAVRLAMRTRAMRHSSLGYGDCFEDPAFIDGEFHDVMVAPLLASRSAWRKQFAMVKSIDHSLHRLMREAHAKIEAPVLFVWGEADRIFPLAKARAMLSQLKNARIDTIPGGKAFVHEDKADAFAARAIPFLRETIGARGLIRGAPNP